MFGEEWTVLFRISPSARTAMRTDSSSLSRAARSWMAAIVMDEDDGWEGGRGKACQGNERSSLEAT